MNLTANNADAIVARLYAWRTKAGAAGRDDDVTVLDAIMGFIRANYPVDKVTPRTTIKGEVLTGTPVTAASAECCLYAGPNGIGCVNCQIDRDRLFTIAKNPNRVYACALKWCEAIRGRDKSFEPK